MDQLIDVIDGCRGVFKIMKEGCQFPRYTIWVEKSETGDNWAWDEEDIITLVVKRLGAEYVEARQFPKKKSASNGGGNPSGQHG